MIKLIKKRLYESNIKKTFWQIMRWDYDQTIRLSDKSTTKTDSKYCN